MGTLPDRIRSRAILIGTSDYERSENLPDLPAVGNNLLDLQRVLTDSETGILDWSSCKVVDSPDSPASLARRLTRVARQAEDLLLVYYAGHGIRHDSKDILYLAVRDTTTENLGTTAVPFDLVKEAIEESPARIRVLILDCCYSGLAIGTMSGEALDLGEIRISGTSVLTSVPKNKKALSPPGERNTAYTGELISLLENGPKVGGGQLTVSALHKGLQAAMANRGLPAPKFLSADTSADLLLRRCSAPRAEPRAEHAVPPPPVRSTRPEPSADRAEVPAATWSSPGFGSSTSGGRRRNPARMLAVLAVLVGSLAALAQCYQYSVDGRFNLVLSAVSAVLGIFGVAGLLAVKDRRAALIGAVAMLCVIGTASGAAYFVRPTGQAGENRPIDNASSSVGASSSPSSEVSSSSPAASQTAGPLTVANPVSGLSPAVNPPMVTTTPPTTPPAVVAVDSRGSFDYPVDSQKVAGSSLAAKGSVENVSLDLLCIVKDESGNYFPYTAQVVGGSWNSGPGIGPNRAIERPYSFTVILATATSAAMDEIESRRGNTALYNNEGVGRQLPAGISQLVAVRIERTS